MAHECQNPMVRCGGGQQFTPTPAQGLNMHAQMFVSAQHQATVPVMSQPVMPGPMPSFI